MELLQTIRVMFDDLTEAQRGMVLNTLGAIPHMDSVGYELAGADYSKGNHTLFVLNAEYDCCLKALYMT